MTSVWKGTFFPLGPKVKREEIDPGTDGSFSKRPNLGMKDIIDLGDDPADPRPTLEDANRSLDRTLAQGESDYIFEEDPDENYLLQVTLDSLTDEWQERRARRLRQKLARKRAIEDAVLAAKRSQEDRELTRLGLLPKEPPAITFPDPVLNPRTDLARAPPYNVGVGDFFVNRTDNRLVFKVEKLVYANLVGIKIDDKSAGPDDIFYVTYEPRAGNFLWQLMEKGADGVWRVVQEKRPNGNWYQYNFKKDPRLDGSLDD